MLDFLIHRFAQSALVLVAMACLVFVGVYAIGSPIEMLVPPEADQAERARVVAALGLDLPLHEQFFRFVANVFQGEFGRSFVHNTPAMSLILDRLPATLELATVALLLAIIIGLPLGLIAGLRSETALGRGIIAGSIFGFSLPNFWFGLTLVLFFAVTLQWLPAGGRGETSSFLGVQVSFLTRDGWEHLILPALTLSMFKISLVIRLAYAGTREAVLQDYVKFARAKGLAPKRIVGVHILKTILIPIVTVLGIEFGSMIAFAVVTETVFAWPGMGKLLIDSVTRLDRPVIVAYLMLVAFIFVVLNLLVDIAYSLLDPRIRIGGASR
jgi:peptide/nickel transport system permease protein